MPEAAAELLEPSGWQQRWICFEDILSTLNLDPLEFRKCSSCPFPSWDRSTLMVFCSDDPTWQPAFQHSHFAVVHLKSYWAFLFWDSLAEGLGSGTSFSRPHRWVRFSSEVHLSSLWHSITSPNEIFMVLPSVYVGTRFILPVNFFRPQGN